MSFASARSVIENSSIGFSCLDDLNDPFECAALCFESSNEFTSKAQYNPNKKRLSDNYGVLSLTRNPLNPLMWAHYGDDHRGVVVGIDTDKALLNQIDNCVIPANDGEIIYTTTMPQNKLAASDINSLMSVGNECSTFKNHNFELFKNAFLYKSLVWGYEEEIRVVKKIRSDQLTTRYNNSKFSTASGDWEKIQVYGRPLYCLSIPSESIVEAYLGCSTYSNVSRLGLEQSAYTNTRNKWKSQGINVHIVRRKDNSWKLEVSDFQV